MSPYPTVAAAGDRDWWGSEGFSYMHVSTRPHLA